MLNIVWELPITGALFLIKKVTEYDSTKNWGQELLQTLLQLYSRVTAAENKKPGSFCSTLRKLFLFFRVPCCWKVCYSLVTRHKAKGLSPLGESEKWS